jgi:hypothetical protein
MPSMRFVSGPLTAGQIVTNVLSGSKFEFLPVASMVEVYAVTDSGAAANAGVQMELTLGNVIEFDQMEVPSVSNNSVSPGIGLYGQGPNLQDHRVGGGVGAAGDRVVIKLQQGSVAQAAANTVRTLVVITPV